MPDSTRSPVRVLVDPMTGELLDHDPRAAMLAQLDAANRQAARLVDEHMCAVAELDRLGRQLDDLTRLVKQHMPV